MKAGFHGETPDFLLSNKQAVYCFQFVSSEMTLQSEKGQTLYKIQMIISKSNALGQDDTVVLMALRLKLKSCMFQCICCNPSRGKCIKLLQCLFVLYCSTTTSVTHLKNTKGLNHSSSSMSNSFNLKLFPCSISKQLFPRISIISRHRTL